MKRSFVAVLGLSVLLGACQYKTVNAPSLSARDAEYMALVPKFETQITHMPYEITDPTGEAPGTIVVDTTDKFLYFVLPNKKAIRYGVATGDEAFGWTGTAVMQRKAEWPRWTPPDEMVARWPHLKPVAGGMNGGPNNPLGARALYLYQNGQDTLYRIHGNMDVHSIGKAVSSGCVRLLFHDIIDLYERVPSGSPIVVLADQSVA